MIRRTPAQPYLANLAMNVCRLRRRCAYTQARLAELAELDVRYVQRIERARANLTVDALVRIADALGVTPLELLVVARSR